MDPTGLGSGGSWPLADRLYRENDALWTTAMRREADIGTALISAMRIPGTGQKLESTLNLNLCGIVMK